MSAQEKDSKIDVVKVVKRNPLSLIVRPEEQEFIRVLVENLARELVSHPEEIRVTFSNGEKTTIYNLDCTQRIYGQLIGSGGKNIQSLRTLVQAMTARRGFRSIIEIPYFKQDK